MQAAVEATARHLAGLPAVHRNGRPAFLCPYFPKNTAFARGLTHPTCRSCHIEMVSSYPRNIAALHGIDRAAITP